MTGAVSSETRSFMNSSSSGCALVASSAIAGSAAVGAVTGALLGAKFGEEALPEFYLDCLEPTELLRELADDLAQGCPMEKASLLYDGDWDRKYRHAGM